MVGPAIQNAWSPNLVQDNPLPQVAKDCLVKDCYGVHHAHHNVNHLLLMIYGRQRSVMPFRSCPV